MSEITFRDLTADDVEVRVATVNEKGCSLLLYKDARCDMRVLDDAVGAKNWQCSYERIGTTLFCQVGIRDDDDEWVWKQDCGVPSNMEGEKGEASDAFKRACFKWGIGRELYTAPFIWVPKEACNIVKGKNGKPTCYDRFEVDVMSVEDGRIRDLVIFNRTRNLRVFPRSGGQSPKNEPIDEATAAAKRRLWEAVKRYAELQGRDPNEVITAVKGEKGYTETAEHMNAKAEEFEAACQVNDAG